MLLACMREGAETGMPADARALKKYGMDIPLKTQRKQTNFSV